jgi:hypothetical protein
MNKMILMLSALLLSQAGNAMTGDDDIGPKVDGLTGSEVVYTADVLLETQRQQMLAEMKQSLRSSLIVDSRPAFAVSRPSSRIDNHQF